MVGLRAALSTISSYPLRGARPIRTPREVINMAAYRGVALFVAVRGCVAYKFHFCPLVQRLILKNVDEQLDGPPDW